MSAFLDSQKETFWVEYVGRFMMAFGLIESCVNELLRRSCSAATLKFVLPLMLKPRFELLSLQLTEWTLSDANRKVLVDTLGEAQGLAKHRNHIAHNPLILSWFRRDETGSGFAKAAIWSEHSGKIIEYGDMKKYTERAEQVALALQGIWVELDMADMQAREPLLKPPK